MKNIFHYHKDLFIKAFVSATIRVEESDAKRRQLLLHLLIFTSVLFLILFGMYAFYMVTLDHYLKKEQNYLFVTKAMIGLLSSLFFYLFFFKSTANSDYLWTYIVPISVVFLMPGRKGIYFALYYISAVILFFVIDFPPGRYDLDFKVRYTGVYLAIGLISYFLEFVRRKTHKGLELKNAELDKTIQELKSKDEQLRESSREYRMLFEQSNDAIIIMKGIKFIDFNVRALKMFGYTNREFSKLNALKISADIQPDGSHSKMKAFQYLNMAKAKDNTRFEWVYKKKDGAEFYGDINLHKMSKGVYFATIRDIDYQKRFEKDLIKAKEEAERSDKLKTEFLAQMSHEIRTPINAIVNFSSLLKEELESKIGYDDLIAFEAIQKSATRLMRTINLILNISEVESGSFSPVFLKTDLVTEIINPILKEIKPMADEQGISLTFDNQLIQPEEINIDVYSVTQIVLNIIDNAIKYTSEGEVNLKLYKNKNSLVLDIVDTGVGISEKYLPHLFDKFSQEEQGYSRSFEGNGLGLALVKEYCRINNIAIEVESHKGSGSKFTLIFTHVATPVNQKQVHGI